MTASPSSLRAIPNITPVDVRVRLADFPTMIRESGTGSLGVVLMLHSLGLDRNSFDFLRQALKPGWRVLAFDQRGHGVAAAETSDRLAQYVQDAVAALDRCGDGPVHLVGHSMGGAVAACVAAEAPHRLASLALLACPAAGMPAFAERGVAAEVGGMEAVLEPTLSRWFGPAPGATAAAAVRYSREALLAMRPSGFAAAWRALASFEGFERLVERLPPTVCVAGAEDLSTPPAVMERIVDAFMRGSTSAPPQLQVVERAGHMLPLTAPEAVAAHLQSHWTSAKTITQIHHVGASK